MSIFRKDFGRATGEFIKGAIKKTLDFVGVDIRTKQEAEAQKALINSLHDKHVDGLNHTIRLAQENYRLKVERKDLKEQVIKDSLTKLFNRLHLHLEVEHNHTRAQDHRCEKMNEKVLFLLDLDGFKTINDTHGHHVGDIVLKEFADRLQAVLRKTDSIEYRMGGDEFAVIAHGCDEEGAKVIKEKIFSCVVDPVVVADAENSGEYLYLDIGTSVGLCCYNAKNTSLKKFLEEVYPEADNDLYQSKAGKQKRFFEKELQEAEAAGIVCRQIPLDLGF